MRSILIFAHVPPPHHGQSYMVAQLLEELRARPDEVRVFHVDSRVSDSLEEVGRAGGGKVLRLLRYCFEAIRLRWRHGPMIFYYVPAPAKRGALYRDWLVMLLCRPFFQRKLLLHWHAVGLGEWIGSRAGFFTSLVSRQLLGKADLILILAQAVADDAAVFQPKQVRVLPNGIPDPCPDFDAAVLPARLARTRNRQGIFRVLFLAHCTREKGLYDALEAVFIAQEQINRENSDLRLTFTAAGQFLGSAEQAAFLEKASQLTREWRSASGPPPVVEYAGFVAGEAKDRLFRESDCFCFPTFYPNEVMPVTLIEALAYGLPIVATRWRAIPEMLPAGNVGCSLIDARQPAQVAQALLAMTKVSESPAAALRRHFIGNYLRGVFGARIVAALSDLD